ncbi:hypothetical protein SAMN05216317_10273 [Nitrosomonas eutropha]|nr:hypothetical protein SAMN05216317_10273 [Nitrosomonas eutropha]
MRLFRIRNYDEYVAHSVRVSGLIAEHQDYLKSHTPEGRHVFTLPGYSYTAQKQVNFLVDYQHAGESVLFRNVFQ